MVVVDEVHTYRGSLGSNIAFLMRRVRTHLQNARQDWLPDPKPEDEAIQDAVYEIKSGDTLGAVAKHFYGKASLYTRIFEANRDIVDDPNTIYPGQKIRIPLD